MVPVPTCADCDLPIGTERWVKNVDRLYHGRCWDVMRSQATLKNAHSVNGERICPKCNLAIRTSPTARGTGVHDGYVVHVSCESEAT